MSMVSKLVTYEIAHTCLRLTSFSIALCVLGAFNLPAQERTAASPVRREQAIISNLTAGIQTSLTAVAAELNLQCTTSALSTPPNALVGHGTVWTEQCPLGFTGSLTKTCVHGVTAIRENGCRTARPCGAHQSGDTWTGSCAEGLTGQLVYQCLDGNVVILPTDVNPASKCEKHDCHGTTYTTACPASVEGTAMFGDITYTCTNNVLSMTGNTCHTYNRPCGPHLHGTSWATSCGNGNAGQITNTCWDGVTTSVSNCGVTVLEVPEPVAATYQYYWSVCISHSGSGWQHWGCSASTTSTASSSCASNLPEQLKAALCPSTSEAQTSPSSSMTPYYTVQGDNMSGYTVYRHTPYCSGEGDVWAGASLC